MKIYAFIPARSGSKGVKNKNIKKINNIPLINYSINFAIKSNLFDKIIVSTDSKKIYNISKKAGAETPFLRPKKYSTDYSTDFDVFSHFIKWLIKNNQTIPDLICHLRPTTPVRSINTLKKTLNIMRQNKKFSCLRTVIPSNFSPYKIWVINKKKLMEPLIKSSKPLHSMGRQSLRKTYKHVGYIDILRIEDTILKKSITGKKIYPYILSETEIKHFVDIDNYNDFNNAKKIVSENLNLVK
ncbi:NeuA CMP-N-acetylneuraminic acid synthetase [Candidatus Pelagibacterales bacterium]